MRECDVMVPTMPPEILALLTALDRIVAELAPGWRVMAQVSLGEVLRCDDEDAYRCINSKRVDL